MQKLREGKDKFYVYFSLVCILLSFIEILEKYRDFRYHIDIIRKIDSMVFFIVSLIGVVSIIIDLRARGRGGVFRYLFYLSFSVYIASKIYTLINVI